MYAAGQVLLLVGADPSYNALCTMQLVDLATGVSTPQGHLLQQRMYPATARLLDSRVVCAGGTRGVQSSAEVWGPPEQGGQDAAWTWTHLPAISEGRYCCSECVISDGLFAVLGGWRPISPC